MNPFSKLQAPGPIDLPTDYASLSPQSRRLVREQYVQQQEGRCAHCDEPLTGSPSPWVAGAKINKKLFPENFFDHPVHLHHSHVTGLTIGAVHAHCNAVLWQYHGE